MKYLERLGAYSMSNFWFWPCMIGVVTLVVIFNMPKSITLDEKHWECGPNPIPDGLGARCTTYLYKGK